MPDRTPSDANPAAGRGAGPGSPPRQARAHFRAHLRHAVHLGVTLRAERGGWERAARVINLHVAGAGIESEEPLVAGERITVAFMTPTLWDPLVLSAVVAWAHPVRANPDELDAFGRPRISARAGLAFDYATPDATLAVFEMLSAIGFE